MKAYTHSVDADGWACAAIIKKKYPDCEMFGINHGEKFPWNDIVIGETVIMADFSLPMADMVKLKDRCNLIVIDHHQSFIDACDEQGEIFQGVQLSGVGACVLAWNYLFTGTDVPYAVELISDWDVWQFKHDATKPFQYALRVEDTSPESPIWDRLLSDDSDKLIHSMLSKGLAIMEYSKQEAIIQCQAAFETELEGLKCIAINKLFSGSNLFDSVWDPEKYDAMISFGWYLGRWKVSLRSEAVDVSKIAVKYGGGGHAQACGFSCYTLPFDLHPGADHVRSV